MEVGRCYGCRGISYGGDEGRGECGQGFRYGGGGVGREPVRVSGMEEVEMGETEWKSTDYGRLQVASGILGSKTRRQQHEGVKKGGKMDII